MKKITYKVIYLTEDTTINWRRDYNVHALNLDTKLFEETNEICGDDDLVIHMLDDITNVNEEQEEIFTSEIKKIEYDGYSSIEFLLYYQYRLVGYVEKVDTFGL